MRRLLGEPLVHFILLAGLIFLAYAWLSDRQQTLDSTIIVSRSDMERMAALYAVEAGALPGERDLRAMISDHVQQQALAREARKLGMAEGDTVVERRLAQKMTFMLSDLEEPDLPDSKSLEAWYEAHADQFMEPARWSFQHVFFADASGPRVSEALAQLGGTEETDWRTLGDPFMLQREYSELPSREVVRLFGSDFLTALKALDVAEGGWGGPVVSALGAHIVRVRKRSEAYLPPLEDIRPAVEAAWQEEARRAQTAREIEAIVGQYDVVIAGEAYP